MRRGLAFSIAGRRGAAGACRLRAQLSHAGRARGLAARRRGDLPEVRRGRGRHRADRADRRPRHVRHGFSAQGVGARRSEPGHELRRRSAAAGFDPEWRRRYAAVAADAAALCAAGARSACADRAHPECAAERAGARRDIALDTGPAGHRYPARGARGRAHASSARAARRPKPRLNTMPRPNTSRRAVPRRRPSHRARSRRLIRARRRQRARCPTTFPTTP